ncbi:MAG: hypothetical protein FWE90_02985 [Defluviitaleaceae bacterium]|nr:hypothetical protein [Defluviitaleaceae bacterium]
MKYQIYQRYSAKNNNNGIPGIHDFFLMQAQDAQPAPWCVVAKQGLFSVFFQTLREAQNFCLRRGFALPKGGE